VVAVIAVMIFALVDIAMSKESQLRVLNRPVWIMLVVVMPGLGAILWFVIGKSRGRATPTAPMGPDDDDEFVRNLGKETVDERIRRLEEELRELDSEFEAPASDSSDEPRSDDHSGSVDADADADGDGDGDGAQPSGDGHPESR
jgi:hypothetical protein